jgi:hypothetical protein
MKERMNERKKERMNERKKERMKERKKKKEKMIGRKTIRDRETSIAKDNCHIM